MFSERRMLSAETRSPGKADKAITPLHLSPLLTTNLFHLLIPAHTSTQSVSVFSPTIGDRPLRSPMTPVLSDLEDMALFPSYLTPQHWTRLLMLTWALSDGPVTPAPTPGSSWLYSFFLRLLSSLQFLHRPIKVGVLPSQVPGPPLLSLCTLSAHGPKCYHVLRLPRISIQPRCPFSVSILYPEYLTLSTAKLSP